MVGPITAKLYASTSAGDTDWMVRLVDVHPDGYAAFLCEGVMRARHRDPLQDGKFNPDRLSTLQPGEVYPYTIEFWRATGNALHSSGVALLGWLTWAVLAVLAPLAALVDSSVPFALTQAGNAATIMRSAAGRRTRRR